MIDRRPHDWQPERHIHRLAERDELHRNQPLIVVTGDHDVEVAAPCADEHRVCRKGTRHVDAAGAAGSDCGRDDRLLFASEQTVLAGMWIESGHGNPRPRSPEPRQLAPREIDGRFERSGTERARHVGQRDVHGGEHDTQDVRVKHHRNVARARQVGQQIGVPGPRQTGQPEGLLVDRRRGNRVDLAFHRRIDGAHHGVVRRPPCLGGQHTRRKRGAGVRPEQNRLAAVEHTRIGGRSRRDFGPDAGRVAAGNGDARPTEFGIENWEFRIRGGFRHSEPGSRLRISSTTHDQRRTR